MMIRPGGSAGEQVAYAAGRFADNDDGFIVYQTGGVSPFGSLLVSAGSDYASEIRADGFGRSWFAGMDVIAQHGMGRAWYLRDAESGATWSAFLNPVCEKADEYAVKFLPGQATVSCLKGKIDCELTVATLPGQPCEVWRVRLENCSARDRSISFTTYVEPAVASSLESKYVEKERAILLRRPLDAIEIDRTDGAAQDLVLVHSSTLAPSRVQTSRAAFIGEGRTLRNPRQLESTPDPNTDGVKNGVIASVTVEVDLPIEGVAEFGFCFGLASSTERALHLSRSLCTLPAIDEAVSNSLENWNQMLSAVRARTSDRAFDALVNTWLPYEAYAGWIRERTGTQQLDPARMADLVRGSYALAAGSPELLRECVTSFAAGLTVLGRYSHPSGSTVSIPTEELLWLPAAAARYVAETGDSGILDSTIAFRDGPHVTLREHSERILRMCANGDGERAQMPNSVLRDVARDWAQVSPCSAEIAGVLEAIRNRSEAEAQAIDPDLPARVRHLQSICRSLEDRSVAASLRSNAAVGGSRPGDTGAAVIVHRTLVEDALGVRATCAGLVLEPRLPESWYQCEVTRRYRGDTYHISLRRSSAGGQSTSIVVDGEPVLGNTLPLFGDGGLHRVEVTVV